MKYKAFDDYQDITKKTAVYPNKGRNLIYSVIGLAGETGEVAEKVKKLIRDGNSKLTKERRIEMAKEFGDVLWYVSQISFELNLKLSDIARMNVEKILSRAKRDKIGGSGDNR